MQHRYRGQSPKSAQKVMGVSVPWIERLEDEIRRKKTEKDNLVHMQKDLCEHPRAKQASKQGRKKDTLEPIYLYLRYW